MSNAVVTVVTETKNVSSDEITPLYETVDPDALNELFDSNAEREPVHVAFNYEECAVEIAPDRTVTVEPVLKTDD